MRNQMMEIEPSLDLGLNPPYPITALLGSSTTRKRQKQDGLQVLKENLSFFPCVYDEFTQSFWRPGSALLSRHSSKCLRSSKSWSRSPTSIHHRHANLSSSSEGSSDGSSTTQSNHRWRTRAMSSSSNPQSLWPILRLRYRKKHKQQRQHSSNSSESDSDVDRAWTICVICTPSISTLCTEKVHKIWPSCPFCRYDTFPVMAPDTAPMSQEGQWPLVMVASIEHLRTC